MRWQMVVVGQVTMIARKHQLILGDLGSVVGRGIPTHNQSIWRAAFHLEILRYPRPCRLRHESRREVRPFRRASNVATPHSEHTGETSSQVSERVVEHVVGDFLHLHQHGLINRRPEALHIAGNDGRSLIVRQSPPHINGVWRLNMAERRIGLQRAIWVGPCERADLAPWAFTNGVVSHAVRKIRHARLQANDLLHNFEALTLFVHARNSDLHFLEVLDWLLDSDSQLDHVDRRSHGVRKSHPPNQASCSLSDVRRRLGLQRLQRVGLELCLDVLRVARTRPVTKAHYVCCPNLSIDA
mmetsp:Transcript_32699/g.71359  ORF Transcript_32699/g.71359 Transcript_32699/m.71359 type:complete len:298 (+) Transcript_32699:1039-1932(+)